MGSGSTIFADDAGASSAGEECDGSRSVFRDHETTTECDDEPDGDSEFTDDGDSTGDGQTTDDRDSTGDTESATDGAAVADEEAAEARTMLVFSGGQRREFRVDDQ